MSSSNISNLNNTNNSVAPFNSGSKNRSGSQFDADVARALNLGGKSAAPPAKSSSQAKPANSISLASSTSSISANKQGQILYKPSSDGKTREPLSTKEVEDFRAQNLKSTQDYNAFIAADKEKAAKDKENNTARAASENVKIAKALEDNQVKITENNKKIGDLQKKLDGYNTIIENFPKIPPSTGPSVPQEYWLSRIVSSQISDLKSQNSQLSSIDTRSLGISPRFNN